MSIAEKNDIKLWDLKSFECIHIFNNIYEKGFITACFFKDNNQPYIITGCSKNHTSIKIFDFKGKLISEIGLFNDFNYYYSEERGVHYINTFEISSSIIIGSRGEIIIYEDPFSLSEKKIYKHYGRSDIFYNNIILDEKNKRIIALCLEDFKKIIRIWNFYCEQVIAKIDLYDTFQWNDTFLLDNNYLFLTNGHELNIIDFKRTLIINSYKEKNKILSIKNIFHPILGKCIIILEEIKKINLLKITETYDDIEENISPKLLNYSFNDDYNNLEFFDE